ncbi:MAG: diphthine synthase [Thermoplasmata archaeon]|nr:diphthine synthase [Thermoplasmata archaeon]
MAELWFIGVGLDDEQGLSSRGLTRVRAAQAVFAEEYTSTLAPGSLERLAGSLGRPVRRLERSELEDGAPILAALAEGGPVALLVPGDPFAATTHVALRVLCENAGHVWRYVPNASILTAAAGLLGLMHYRFGGTVSLPLPEPGFAPVSPLERIARNRSVDLHTLVLLDLRPSEGRYLMAGEALGILRERDPDGKAVPRGSLLAVVARVGSDTSAAWFGTVESLLAQEFGPPKHALVVPAPSLHFEEEAALQRYRVK